jgi:protein involved in polysaccharide export with SLBB domain
MARSTSSFRALAAALILSLGTPLAALAQVAPPSAAPTGAEKIRVQVVGAVLRPGYVELSEGDRLSLALARAGADAAVKPDLSRVYLTRADATAGKTAAFYLIDVYQALQRGDQRYDPILRNGDKIFVPEKRALNVKMIAIKTIAR